MSGEIDLSGEQDPTERMTEQDEKLTEDLPENHRDAEFEGENRTEEFDLTEALDRV